MINIKEKNLLYKLFLIELIDDYAGFIIFIGCISEVKISTNFNYIKYLLIGTITDLVNDGMMEIGELNPNNNWDFEKWSYSDAESLALLNEQILKDIPDYDSLWDGSIHYFNFRATEKRKSLR